MTEAEWAMKPQPGIEVSPDEWGIVIRAYTRRPGEDDEPRDEDQYVTIHPGQVHALIRRLLEVRREALGWAKDGEIDLGDSLEVVGGGKGPDGSVVVRMDQGTEGWTQVWFPGSQADDVAEAILMASREA